MNSSPEPTLLLRHSDFGTMKWYAIVEERLIKPYGRYIVPQTADGACLFHTLNSWGKGVSTVRETRNRLVDAVLAKVETDSAWRDALPDPEGWAATMR